MELLERRQLLAVTIQRTTLNLRFSTDLKPNEAAYGEYQSFKITNTGPTALSDVWVRATNFSPTQKVQLGVGEDGLYFLGDLGVGAANAETAFIYMVAEQITSPPALDPQNFTIEVWRGQPAAPGSTLVTTQNDLFQWVGEAVEDDSSSRTFSVDVSYAYGGAPTTTPIVGGAMTMRVTGDIKNKPDRILFSPASTLAWPADAFVLEDAVVTYSQNPQLPPDTIFEKPIVSKPKDFTVVYTFRIAQPTAMATPVTPVQYTANGVQDLQSRKFDHSQILPGVADIPPATYPLADLQIEKRDFVQTYTPGLPLTWRITVTNNGPNPVTGARVSDVFPAQVSGVSWTAVFTGGSGNPSGTGNINELVNLAVGGTAVYTVNVTTFSTATGSLSNTATVTAPAGITDPNLSNNTWTDVDLPAPGGGLACDEGGRGCDVHSGVGDDLHGDGDERGPELRDGGAGGGHVLAVVHGSELDGGVRWHGVVGDGERVGEHQPGGEPGGRWHGDVHDRGDGGVDGDDADREHGVGDGAGRDDRPEPGEQLGDRHEPGGSAGEPGDREDGRDGDVRSGTDADVHGDGDELGSEPADRGPGGGRAAGDDRGRDVVGVVHGIGFVGDGERHGERGRDVQPGGGGRGDDHDPGAGGVDGDGESREHGDGDGAGGHDEHQPRELRHRYRHAHPTRRSAVV